MFIDVYERNNSAPAADVLQREYLDRGSPELRRFAQLRRITGDTLAAAITKDPDLYIRAKLCAEALPEIVARLGEATARFRKLVPGAEIPAITVAVGRGRPVAVGERRGAYIGLEALCDWTAPDADFRRRAYRVITHELVHTQQRGLAEHAEAPTVLHAALVEGAAEFMTELLTGSVAYRHLAAAMKGREFDFEQAFAKDLDRPAIGSRWVFNSGTSSDQPSNLGYRIGYRIVQAYYRRASNKRTAVANILRITDAHQFLTASGWTPGATLR